VHRISTLLLALSVLVVGLVVAHPSAAGQHCKDTKKTVCLTTRDGHVTVVRSAAGRHTTLTSTAKRPKPRPTKAPAPTTSPTPTATPTPVPTATVTPTPAPTATVTPTPTPSPTSTTVPGLVPPVAKDCSVDVTAGLNAFLAGIPNGSTVDLAGGCYLANGTVLLDRKTGVTVRNGTIKATTDAGQYQNRAQLAVNLGSGITVRDLTLQGSNASADCAQQSGSCYRGSQEWDHNLRVTGTYGVLVDHVTFRHAWGDAVSLSPGGTWDANGNGALMASNVTVQNSSVDTTGRMAFACTGCHNFTAQDNTIANGC